MKTNNEIMAELKTSVVANSRLSEEDFEKLSLGSRHAMVVLNRVVDAYLKAGISWTEITKFLTSSNNWEYNLWGIGVTLPKESEMSLESSCKVLDFLKPKHACKAYLKHDEERYIPFEMRTLNDQPPYFFRSGDRLPFFKKLSLPDVLKIAQLRTEIDHPNTQGRQSKIQKMFMYATQINEGKSFECDLLKKAYDETWTNEDTRRAAFTMLQQIERQGITPKHKELIEYGAPYAVVAARIYQIEDAVKKTASRINYDLLSPALEAVELIRTAEEQKDKGADVAALKYRPGIWWRRRMGRRW